MNTRRAHALQSTALWLVGFHFLAVVVHSVAHEVLKVKATSAQLAFIVPVIILAPPLAGLLLRRSPRAGALTLLASMSGSLVFGLYYHFVADTIDHVAHVARMEPASWSAVFQLTAWLLLVSEAAGAAVAGLLAGASARTLKSHAARTNF